MCDYYVLSLLLIFVLRLELSLRAIRREAAGPS